MFCSSSISTLDGERESVQSQWSQKDEEKRERKESRHCFIILSGMFLYGFICKLVSYRELIWNIWVLFCLTVWLSALFLFPTPLHVARVHDRNHSWWTFSSRQTSPSFCWKDYFLLFCSCFFFHVSCDRLFLPSLIWGSEVAWQGSKSFS